MQILKLRRLVSVLKLFVVPPSIKGGNVTTEISALINSIIKLECETRGLPMPTITWYKDGQPIISSSQALYIDKGQFLHIPRAQVSDSATYTCHVTNVAGTAEKSLHVDVYGKENNMCLDYIPFFPGFLICQLPVSSLIRSWWVWWFSVCMGWNWKNVSHDLERYF